MCPCYSRKSPDHIYTHHCLGRLKGKHHLQGQECKRLRLLHWPYFMETVWYKEASLMAQQGQIRVLEAGLAKHNTDQFNDKNRWQTGKHVPVAATMRGKSAAISGALVVWYCRWLPQKVVHEKLDWLMCFASRKGIRIPESWALESGLQLKESGIPLTIRIQNPSSTDKETRIQYLESGIESVESRIQDCLRFRYMGQCVCWGQKPTLVQFKMKTKL